jgi:aminoglycoside phosphotransferase family enzyme/predicted kinase
MTLAHDLDLWLRGQVGGDGGVQVHETPAAKVFVGRACVLKIKKPVDFGFLDFTTLEKREWAIRRELAFNRQAAPDLYRRVHAIVRTPSGAFALQDGALLAAGGEVVEWALEMRPFAGPVLSDQPERVDGLLAERLGRETARLHAHAPISKARKGSASLAYVQTSNAQQLRSLGDRLDQNAVERLIAASRDALDALAPRLDRRSDDGLMRRCHGDLHLGNIVVEGDRPILFDAIEFNDALSEIDVAYDLAFLLMDLGFRGRPDAANRVLNAWADEAARSLGDAAWESLALLPLCQAMRAAVRAHVSGHAGDPERAKAYVAAGLGHLTAPPPALFAVGGFSGVGKSTFARALAPTLGRAPGAVVLRTDEIRKRQWGAGPKDRLPPDAYGPEPSTAVYAEMLRTARLCLGQGWAVGLDAAFLTRPERKAAEALAKDLALPFDGIWLEAPPDVLRRRLRDRRDDASDADEAVLDRQLARDIGEVRWRRVDVADEGGAPPDRRRQTAKKPNR